MRFQRGPSCDATNESSAHRNVFHFHRILFLFSRIHSFPKITFLSLIRNPLFTFIYSFGRFRKVFSTLPSLLLSLSFHFCSTFKSKSVLSMNLSRAIFIAAGGSGGGDGVGATAVIIFSYLNSFAIYIK